jgi:hypothetical protein
MTYGDFMRKANDALTDAILDAGLTVPKEKPVKPKILRLTDRDGDVCAFWIDGRGKLMGWWEWRGEATADEALAGEGDDEPWPVMEGDVTRFHETVASLRAKVEALGGVPAPAPAPAPDPDPVNHPAHYKVGGIETIDFIEAKGLDKDYHLASCVKYLSRAGKKGDGDSAKELEDLRKGRWYLDRAIARREGK